MSRTSSELAPAAKRDELACRAPKPRSRFVCAAVKGHKGDHVPYGAADSDEGLRKLTWRQRRL